MRDGRPRCFKRSVPEFDYASLAAAMRRRPLEGCLVSSSLARVRLKADSWGQKHRSGGPGGVKGLAPAQSNAPQFFPTLEISPARNRRIFAARYPDIDMGKVIDDNPFQEQCRFSCAEISSTR